MEEKYNTFWQRFFAGLLDGLVLAPFAFLYTFILFAIHNTIIVLLGSALIYSIQYTYTVYFHWQTGQTLGKKWMGIRVIDKDETRLLTFSQAFKRDSIYILIQSIAVIVLSYEIIKLGHPPEENSIIQHVLDWLSSLWFILEVITMMTNEKRRALHDMLAGSVVIKEEYWNGPDTQV